MRILHAEPKFMLAVQEVISIVSRFTIYLPAVAKSRIIIGIIEST